MSVQDEMIRRIQAALPDATVRLDDMTGGGDHWQGTVISAAFAGVSRIQRHRMIYGALGDLMHGPVHAFTFKARTPSEAGD